LAVLDAKELNFERIVSGYPDEQNLKVIFYFERICKQKKRIETNLTVINKRHSKYKKETFFDQTGKSELLRLKTKLIDHNS
jgi:hypothetical protein